MAASGTNLWTPDPDGITRRLPLAIRYDGAPFATFWLAAARRLGAQASVPLNHKGEFVIRWHGDPLTAYSLFPLWEMICSIYPDQCDPTVRRHPAKSFRDRIVLVGASASGSYEVRPTPVSETAPGFFVIATAVDNLLHNQAVRVAPAPVAWSMIVLLAVLPAWPVLRYRSVAVPLALTAAVLTLHLAICFFAYARDLWLPLAVPFLAGVIGFTGTTVLRYLIVDRELSRTRGALERYVSPQLVRYVMDHLDKFRFDGEKRKLTIFFSDVRNFTTLTEQSDPVMLVRQLNEYLEAMTDIVFRHDGIVDKFIGDAVMAHWGAFTPDKPNAMLAAQAALEMMDKLAELNVRWKAQGIPQLDIGIAINTDEVIFGNVGTGKKSDFTAIGDGVNLAARLEGANKEYKTHIIISDSTRAELADAAEVRPLGSIVVKGKTVGVAIYELVGIRRDGSSRAGS
jgi:adenylate cyclase